MAQQLSGAASALGGQAISEALGQAGPLASQLPGALDGAGAAAQQLANAFSQAAPAAEGLSGAFAALGQAASQLPERPPAELTGAVQQAFGDAQSGAQAMAQHMAVGAGNAAALTQQLNTANAALSALSSQAGGAAPGPGTRLP